MAKLLKLRRGSTTQHNSFTGAEGEVTIDTTKDTAVVHDGSQAGGRPLLREDMSNLPAGTIDNADVNASAAIAGTKISPDFGSQNIVTTGDATITGGDLTLSGNFPQFKFVDIEGSDEDSYIVNNANVLALGKTNTPSQANDILVLNLSDQSAQFKGNLDVDSGVDVTGNITVTGTVDGVDVAAANTQLVSISDTSGEIKSSVFLANGVTATTQSASDNTTKVATTAFTTSAISTLTTTVNNNLAAKMPTAGGIFTGDVTFDGATAGRDIIFDRSDNSLGFADDTKLRIGNSQDLEIYHDSSGHSFINNATGNLAIRTTTAGTSVGIASAGGDDMAKFIVDGAVELYHDDSKKLETTGTGVSVTGALVASGDVTAFSDQTLKKDIATINNALDLCGKLRGVSYKWIKDDKPSIGVIAQEVETHIPEVVTTTQLDGADVKSVDYGKIVGVLINAVNELKAELDEYKGLYEKKNFLLADDTKATFLVKKITDETAPDGGS